jgi:hypothetical protein
MVKAPVSLLVLYAVNAFLFLVLSFFFLPDSIVKVLGSAAGVLFGVLGFKSLNPREADSESFITRYRGLFTRSLSVAALLQSALLLIGFFNPCRIWTIPGSTVLVDGKFLARTPDPSERREDINAWLTPQPNRYFLRWDTHEIKVRKNWYVTKDGSPEFVKNVLVHGLQLWWNPAEAFREWKIDTTGLRPLFKISYGIPSAEPRDGEPRLDELGQAVKYAVQRWDFAWNNMLGQSADYDRTDPYVVELQVVDGHVELQIHDWTNHPMKPLQAIHPIDYGETGSSVETRLSTIRTQAFEQLLTELAISTKLPQEIEETEKVADLTQVLNKQVNTGPALTEPPLPSPTRTPAIFPSPAVGFTPAPIETPPPTASSSPASANVVNELATIATQAAKKNRLDVAIAAQKTLRQVGQRQLRDPELARDLQQANAAVGDAIRSKGSKGRIYVHIADESQREPARRLRDVLVKNNGFAVIGIQNVGGRAYIPDTAEVRYFAFPEPAATKQAADEIVAILRNRGVQNARASYVIPTQREKTESSDINTHFEIWFARDSFVGSK